MPPEAIFTREVNYIFALKKKELKIRETLYVADMERKVGEGDMQTNDNAQRESHYRYDHPKNSGKHNVLRYS